MLIISEVFGHIKKTVLEMRRMGSLGHCEFIGHTIKKLTSQIFISWAKGQQKIEDLDIFVALLVDTVFCWAEG